MKKWDEFGSNVVFYRSFDPFKGLMKSERVPIAQLWCIWAISYSIKKYRNFIKISFISIQNTHNNFLKYI